MAVVAAVVVVAVSAAGAVLVVDPPRTVMLRVLREPFVQAISNAIIPFDASDAMVLYEELPLIPAGRFARSFRWLETT